MTQQPNDSTVQQSNASTEVWQSGEPSAEGEYRIKYTTPRQPEPQESTGHYLPGHGWLNLFPGMQIIGWSQLNAKNN